MARVELSWLLAAPKGRLLYVGCFWRICWLLFLDATSLSLSLSAKRNPWLSQNPMEKLKFQHRLYRFARVVENPQPKALHDRFVYF